MVKIARFLNAMDITKTGWFFFGLSVNSVAVWPFYSALTIFLLDLVCSLYLIQKDY